jgi:crossover junction endodeoxyribonuclease RuvC
MSSKVFIGIDPGLSGGIAIIEEGSIRAVNMPDTERDVWDLIHSLPRLYSMAMIEKVHSMKGNGVASSFKFGMGYGALRMALVASGIPFEDVTPQKWQKALGCLSGGDKNVTKQRAQSLFPQLKITHKTADSLLIAEYARRTYP